MKIFLRYLMLPLITACIVTVGVVVFYYLDAPQGASNVDLSNMKRRSSKSTFVSKTHHDPSMSYGDFIYPTDGTRDPFQKVSASIDVQQSSGNTPRIMLTGVIWDDEDPVAIITDSDNNSCLVRIGEEISSAKVLSIQPRSITIERDGETQELTLWPAKM